MRNQTLGMLTDSIAALQSSMSSIVPEGLSLDSRTINRGDAFVATKGVDADGRRYINDALTHGAIAVLAEADFPEVLALVVLALAAVFEVFGFEVLEGMV